MHKSAIILQAFKVEIHIRNLFANVLLNVDITIHNADVCEINTHLMWSLSDYSCPPHVQ